MPGHESDYAVQPFAPNQRSIVVLLAVLSRLLRYRKRLCKDDKLVQPRMVNRAADPAVCNAVRRLLSTQRFRESWTKCHLPAHTKKPTWISRECDLQSGRRTLCLVEST